jgi:flagellar hook-associated protein 1 FlgK
MTLFSTINLSKNALTAAQLGLQVTSNNIANANTPGYIRQRLIQSPLPPQRYGQLLLGLGVDVEAVVQVADKYLQERLRAAESDLAFGEAQEDAYVQLEALLGELSEDDLSTALTSFFGSIHDVQNQPESTSVRNLAVLQGRTLTQDVRRLNQGIQEARQDINTRVIAAADEINSLLERIADLNQQIVEAEGGDTSPSDAVGLRDRRALALVDLAKLIDIRTIEQPAGDVSVHAGGEYLVFANQWREVKVANYSDRGQMVAEIRVKDTDARIASTSGKLEGYYLARDEILGGALDDLNGLVESLIFEFNKIYSGGQGLEGHTSLLGAFAVSDVTLALDQAGLAFTPDNGGFDVQVRNTQTGLVETTAIAIDLNGLGADTSLADLAAALDAIDGISATVTPSRQLQISSDSPQIEFTFAGDTSGVLAALGINSFFTGSDASTIDVSSYVRADPARFSASLTGVGEDTEVAGRLANLLTTPLAARGGETLATLYDRLTSNIAQGSADVKSATEGYRVFQRTLEGQHLGISGVNLDEEAVRMITYQRAFQASARVIQTISEMLDILVNL